MPLTDADWQVGEGPLSKEGDCEGTHWSKVVVEGTEKLVQEEREELERRYNIKFETNT